MEGIDIIPLGTASAIPTRTRHPSALALCREGRVLLFDCGEGTQMRFLQAGLKITRLDAVFITHFHGDHYFGLPGLLSTLTLLKRRDPLTVVGPAGIGGALDTTPGLDLDRANFPLEIVELHDAFTHDIVYRTDELSVEARPIDHRTFAAGFRFQERPKPGNLDVVRARELGVSEYDDFRSLKAGRAVRVNGRIVQPDEVIGPERPGRSFAYISDTRPCETGRLLARDVDLLYHEATFTEQHAHRAVETGHSTAREAARIAELSGARRLLIGHISARHEDPSTLLSEARATFKNTEVAEELKRYRL